MERRSALLDAAVELAAEQGAGSVTNRSVAKRAGVPVSTARYFFGSISELMEAALSEYAQRAAAEIEELALSLNLADTSPEQIVDMFADFWAQAPALPAMGRFEAYLSAARGSSLRGAVGDALSSIEHSLELVLRELGCPRAGEAARLFLALSDGMSVESVARPRPDDVEMLRRGYKALFVALSLNADELAVVERRYHTPAGQLWSPLLNPKSPLGQERTGSDPV